MIAVIYEKDFIPSEFRGLENALRTVSGTAFFSVDELNEKLSTDNCRLLINPYGKYFPKDAWRTIIRFLEEGGSILNIGGPLLQYPIRKDDAERWHIEEPQDSYLKEMALNHNCLIPKENIHSLSGATQEYNALAASLKITDSYSLMPRMTDRYDTPSEPGSSGPQDAELQPLVFGLDAAGRKTAAPVIAIKRLLGCFAGGKWVFANFAIDKDFYSGKAAGKIVKMLVDISLNETVDFKVRSSMATYCQGEKPQILIHIKRFNEKAESFNVNVRLSKDGKIIESSTLKLAASSTPIYEQLSLKTEPGPGFYEISATLEKNGTAIEEYKNGFWVRDNKLIESGTPLRCESDYFTKGGKAFPVIGTTYMSGESHRKFLFNPNPYVWDEDFRQMKKMGINTVRTGIWTGIRQIMLDPGFVNESALRAFEAYLHSAFKYDINVIFTFFTFYPEAWSGENPYLSPRSIEAQKEYIAAFAGRFKNAKRLLWDLINEPSFCNPGFMFKTHPNYDDFEKAAWRKWLKEKHISINSLAEKWRCTPSEIKDFDNATLPGKSDFAQSRFNDQFIQPAIRPIKAAEYRLFAEESFTEWASEMYRTIRAAGSNALVTVGLQGEKGLVEDPDPQIFSSAIDFTCMHSWILNDDLLTDSLMAKVPSKPLVIGETGVMYQENIDGKVRDSEEDDKKIFERKLAYAFGCNAAGAIQWQWESNVYKKIHHETALLRSDMTEKPQTEAMWLTAAFLKFSEAFFTEREIEDICVVIPESHMFSAKDTVINSMQKALKALHSCCGRQAYCIGEKNLSAIKRPPAFMILPSARIFSNEGWSELMKFVASGTTLLVTGPVEKDEYWMDAANRLPLDPKMKSIAVARDESIFVGNEKVSMTFARDWYIYADKAVVEGEEAKNIFVWKKGKGEIIFCTHPVELSTDIVAAAKVYDYALGQSLAKPVFKIRDADPAILIRPSVFSDYVLYSIISESNLVKDVAFTHCETGTDISLKLQPERGAMFFIDRKSGKLLSAYIHDEFRVGDTNILPGGDLAVGTDRKSGKISVMPGRRNGCGIKLNIGNKQLIRKDIEIKTFGITDMEISK